MIRGRMSSEPQVVAYDAEHLEPAAELLDARQLRQRSADDWRTSSLRASRAWTALGFRRTHVGLERRIDERMTWADGRR